MKYKDFKSWMSNEKSKEIEALEALAQYKIKSKKKPIAVGDVVRSPYVKADVLTSIDAKNDLYYIQVYDGRVPNSVHGEDFRKYFQHVTAKQLKDFVLQEYARLYIHQCYKVLYFLHDNSKKDNNQALVAWTKQGTEWCRTLLGKKDEK
jgi:hypothetical protein